MQKTLVLLAVVFLYSAYPASAETLVRLVASRDHTVSLSANNSSPPSIWTKDDQAATSQAAGTESSQCEAYGRSSFSRAAAHTKIVNQSHSNIQLAVFTEAYAAGGHFRTCGTCLAGKCTVIKGNDTSATSEAETTTTVTVSLQTPPRRYSYEVEASLLSTTGSVSIRAFRPNGESVAELANRPGIYPLSDRIPVIVIKVTGSSKASNGGGCCNSGNIRSIGDVRVSVEPAALIDASAKLEPFIVGGVQTTGHINAAGVGYKGKMHCSGTLVGKTTVVTAAHCIFNYLQAIQDGHFDVRFGTNFFSPSQNIKVVAAEIPDKAGEAVLFNPQTLEDDIGVLYLASEPGGVSLASINEDPTIIQYAVRDKASVIIVGFGFNSIDGSLIGAGIKREAAIIVDEATNRLIKFQKQGANTCRGDSGGPTFMEVAGTQLRLIAITSGGDGDCTRGVNSRTDAYAAWLLPRLK